jgi:hypothetical protein
MERRIPLPNENAMALPCGGALKKSRRKHILGQSLLSTVSIAFINYQTEKISIGLSIRQANDWDKSDFLRRSELV